MSARVKATQTGDMLTPRKDLTKLIHATQPEHNTDNTDNTDNTENVRQRLEKSGFQGGLISFSLNRVTLESVI